MGRDGIVDVGGEASLKIYIWKVESMEERVVGCGGDGGRELTMYPIEEVLLKKEPDHEDGLTLDGIVGRRFGWKDSVTGKMGVLHNAHEILSLLLCTPAIVVEDVYDVDSAKSEAAEIGSIVSCPE
jgi:hypothetical protein